MKYFFLSESWTTGRIWEFGGLWNELAWNRPAYVERQPLYIRENGDNLWLYKAEEAILMVEVKPRAIADPTIGQVVLKRLLSAEQVVERLCQEEVFHPPAHPSDATDTESPAPPSAEALNQEPWATKQLTPQNQLARLVHQLTPFLRSGRFRPKTAVR